MVGMHGSVSEEFLRSATEKWVGVSNVADARERGGGGDANVPARLAKGGARGEQKEKTAEDSLGR